MANCWLPGSLATGSSQAPIKFEAGGSRHRSQLLPSSDAGSLDLGCYYELDTDMHSSNTVSAGIILFLNLNFG